MEVDKVDVYDTCAGTTDGMGIPSQSGNLMHFDGLCLTTFRTVQTTRLASVP